jgi:hypothetical protein
MARDYENTENGDLLIVNGDAVITDNAEAQLLKKLCQLNTGSLKHNLLVGAGVSQLPNGRVSQSSIGKIVQQLADDNWTNEEVTFDGKNLNVYAERI